MKRLFFALALVIALSPVPAQAAGCDGVTVVVDFRGLGGGVRQGCALGSPASGVAALSAAGFGYTYASQQPGSVCRINGKPGADTDKCVHTSPASAYWSYWHAPAGGSWSYSDSGAASYVPARGTVEGWAFGAGEQPGTAPPAAAAPPPEPPQPQAPAPVNPPAARPQPTTTAPPVTSSPSSAPTSEASSTPVAAAATTTAASGTIVIEQVPPSPEEKAGSGWWWTAIGVLVIAGLVVAGLLVARRRRGVEEA